MKCVNSVTTYNSFPTKNIHELVQVTIIGEYYCKSVEFIVGLKFLYLYLEGNLFSVLSII